MCTFFFSGASSSGICTGVPIVTKLSTVFGMVLVDVEAPLLSPNPPRGCAVAGPIHIPAADGGGGDDGTCGGGTCAYATAPSLCIGRMHAHMVVGGCSARHGTARHGVLPSGAGPRKWPRVCVPRREEQMHPQALWE